MVGWHHCLNGHEFEFFPLLKYVLNGNRENVSAHHCINRT